MTDRYEFNDVENKTIEATGARAIGWGAISIIVGGFQIVTGVTTLSKGGFMPELTLAGGVVGIVVGVTFLAFGRTLKNVVQTKGNDIALMMGALKSLGAAFVIQIVAASAGFAIGVVASAIGIAK
jgi:hypothetical protein